MKQPVNFPAGGGSIGALMRSHDWSRSPLGIPEHWPRSLKDIVAVMLESQFPMFVAWGTELSFLYNDAYARILGSKHPQALGSRFRDIWAEIWTDVAPLVDAAMNGEASYRENLPLVLNRKGCDEQAWFTFSYSPIRDDAGRVCGLFCAVSETTSKVVAERTLRELNETLERRVGEAIAERKLFADIVEATYAFVQVADCNYRWLAINEAAANEFERIFGVRPRVGLSMLDVLADKPEHQAAVKSVWARALAGEEFTLIDEFGDPSRDRRAYEMRFSTLRDRDGHRIGAYQFVYDITQRVENEAKLRRAEDALHRAQKLESLGQLTGGVAHDFNNLLSVFANGVQVLAREVTPQRRDRVLDAMRRAVTRGSGLTHHLLAFSRRQPVHPEPINITAHLEGMRDMLHASLRGDIEIEMKSEPELWEVEVDPGEFELAILNLCVNARDAMRGGGRVTIVATNSREHEQNGHAADFVQLSVIDTGTGMSAEVQARVFEPFFTTKDVGKGSGLGLPQVYGFVQQSRGRIDIDSKLGVGTKVTLTLPRASCSLSKLDAESAASTPRSDSAWKGHLLLVEDDNEVAELTREMLGCIGFSVVHAASPDAALGALTSERSIGYVLSDIMMPGGVDGVELARQIRKQQPQLQVVLTTGYPEAGAAIEQGEFVLLPKPYTLESLAEAFGFQV